MALFIAALLLIFSLAVFVANISILLAVRRLRTLRKVVTYFVSHLAMADIIFGIGALARSAMFLAEGETQVTCMLVLCLIIISGGCGVTGILLLSLESYLTVRSRHVVQKTLQKTRALWMIAGCWLFWIAVAVGSFLTQHKSVEDDVSCYFGNAYFDKIYMACSCVIVFLHFGFILYFQIGVILCLRKHFKKLRTNMASRTPKSSITGQPTSESRDRRSIDSTNAPTVSQIRLQQKWLKKQVSLTKLIALVCCLFCLCWYPTFFALFLNAVCGQSCHVSSDVIVYLAMFLQVHSFLNVIAYVVRSQEFRQALKSLYCSGNKRMGNRVANVNVTGAPTPTEPSALRTGAGPSTGHSHTCGSDSGGAVVDRPRRLSLEAPHSRKMGCPPLSQCRRGSVDPVPELTPVM